MTNMRYAPIQLVLCINFIQRKEPYSPLYHFVLELFLIEGKEKYGFLFPLMHSYTKGGVLICLCPPSPTVISAALEGDRGN